MKAFSLVTPALCTSVRSIIIDGTPIDIPYPDEPRHALSNTNPLHYERPLIPIEIIEEPSEQYAPYFMLPPYANRGPPLYMMRNRAPPFYVDRTNRYPPKDPRFYAPHLVNDVPYRAPTFTIPTQPINYPRAEMGWKERRQFDPIVQARVDDRTGSASEARVDYPLFERDPVPAWFREGAHIIQPAVRNDRFAAFPAAVEAFDADYDIHYDLPSTILGDYISNQFDEDRASSTAALAPLDDSGMFGENIRPLRLWDRETVVDFLASSEMDEEYEDEFLKQDTLASADEEDMFEEIDASYNSSLAESDELDSYASNVSVAQDESLVALAQDESLVALAQDESLVGLAQDESLVALAEEAPDADAEAAENELAILN